jgi:hypothetical protein
MTLLATTRALGFTVTADGDTLVVSPASRLTPELRAQLRAAKPEIHLRAEAAAQPAAEARAAVIADLLPGRWPIIQRSAAPPPDILALCLTDAEIGELFTKASSRQAHLALVDQPAIRDRLGDPELAATVKAAWAQKSVS